MNPTAIKQSIRSFLSGYIRAAGFADDRDLFASGLVNSLFAMELVLFIEKTFGFAVSSAELRIDNFRTLDAMAALVVRETLPSRPQPGAGAGG